jgi:hypothetical protein
MRMRRLICATLLAASCLADTVDSGACNHNHVCEPDESYEVCPQDCYWHSEGAEVFGKPSLRPALAAPRPEAS